MPLNDASLTIAAQAMADAIDYLSLHSAAPDATGSNETSAARVAATWAAAANGDVSLSGTHSFTGGAASGACTHVGFWSLAAGGTFYGYQALTGDQTFNAAGEYDLTALSLAGDAA